MSRHGINSSLSYMRVFVANHNYLNGSILVKCRIRVYKSYSFTLLRRHRSVVLNRFRVGLIDHELKVNVSLSSQHIIMLYPRRADERRRNKRIKPRVVQLFERLGRERLNSISQWILGLQGFLCAPLGSHIRWRCPKKHNSNNNKMSTQEMFLHFL